MTRIRLGLVVVLALVLQTSVLVHLHPAGVVPDLMILLAVAAGLVGGPPRGAVVGFVSGIAIDLFLQTPVGLSALAFSLVGHGAGLVAEGTVRATWWLPVVTVLVASGAGEVLFAVSGAVVGETQLLVPRLALVAVVVGTCNAIVSPIALRLMRWTLAGSSLAGTSTALRSPA